MLLCALGYKAEIEGYTGSDYTIAIARDANKNDLFKSLSIVTSANLTREQAAQMAFNALKATTVEYQGGTNVTTSDGTSVIVNAVRNEVKRTSGKDYRNGETETANGTQQLVEKLYGADLILTETDSNDFGAPAEKWSYKNAEVGTYASDADATFTKKVTYGDLYTAIGSTAVKRLQAANTGSTLTVKVDNKADTSAYPVAANKITKGSDEEIAFTGKGVTTSVYVKDSTTAGEYDVTIVAVNTYVGKVSTVTKATASADRYINITNKGTSVDLKDNGKFETEAFAKDDYVLFTAAWNNSKYEVKTVAAAEKVSAAEVTTMKGTSEFTAAGTTYKYAKTYAATVEIGNAYDLYLDANGYVAYAELVNEAVDYSNYIVITKDAKESGLGDKIIANAVKMDGTMVSNITLGKLGSDKITAKHDGSGVKVDLNKLYSFTVGSDGKYNLKKVAAPYDTVVLTGQNSQVDGYKYHTGDTAVGSATIDNKTVSFAANNATTFIVYNNDKDTVTVYNGIKNMVNIADTANLTSVNALYKTAGTAKLVFINTNATSVNTASAKDLVYLLDTTPRQSKVGDDTIYTYAAIVNGEVSTIKSKTEISSADQKLYYISAYEDGYVTTIGNPVNGTPENYAYKTATGKAATYADGVFTIVDNGSYVLADKCALYSIDKDGNVSTISADALENTDTSIEYTVVTKTNNNVTEAIAVYVQAK